MSIPYAEVIGDPVAHSRSPQIHRAWLREAGIEADYRATRVQADDLAAFLEDRRANPAWRGCNVTAPLKELALGLVDDLSEPARSIGAINIIARRNGRLIGENSDVDGIAAALPSEIVLGQSAILIGAGGAARAALHFLSWNGASKVQLVARDPARAMAMYNPAVHQCPLLVTRFDGPLVGEPRLVINASPIGMAQAPTPAPLLELISRLGRSALLFDMVYQPVETELLRTARRHRLRTVGGMTMLRAQAARAFQLLYGTEAPIEGTVPKTRGIDGWLGGRTAVRLAG